MSVTEKEVEKGLLIDPKASERCAVFIRNFSNSNLEDKIASRYFDLDYAAEKTQHLKDLTELKIPSILQNKGFTHRYEISWTPNGVDPEEVSHREYLEKFAADFVETIKQLINTTSQKYQLQKGHLKEFEEIIHHSRISLTKCKSFHGREEELNLVQKFLKDPCKNTPLVISGKSGVGKTAFVAKSVELMFKIYPESVVIQRYLGTSPESSTPISLIQSIIQQLCFVFAIEDVWSKSSDVLTTLSKNFLAIMEYISAKFLNNNFRLFIVLDSLDQLSNYNDLTWIPDSLPNNCKMFLSTIPNEILLKLQSKINHLEILTTSSLSSHICFKIIEASLKDKSRKLTDDQWNIVRYIFKNGGDALYTKLIVDTIVEWKSYDIINISQLSITIKEAIGKVFKKCETELGSVFVKYAFAYLSISRQGLAEVELLDSLSCTNSVLDSVYVYHSPPCLEIIQIPPLLPARLLDTLSAYLSKRRVDEKSVFFWYHRQFWETAWDIYVKNLDLQDLKQLYQNMIEIYTSFDGVRKDLILTKRNLSLVKVDRGVSKKDLSSQRTINCVLHYSINSLLHNDETCKEFRKKTLFNFDWLLKKIVVCSISDLLLDLLNIMKFCQVSSIE